MSQLATIIFPLIAMVCLVGPPAATFLLLGLRARRAQREPRIDWPKVYANELEVWGQMFEHAGAPPYQPPKRFPMQNVETLVAAHKSINAKRREAGLPELPATAPTSQQDRHRFRELDRIINGLDDRILAAPTEKQRQLRARRRAVYVEMKEIAERVANGDHRP